MILRRSANKSNPVHPDSDQDRGHLGDPSVTEDGVIAVTLFHRFRQTN